MPDPPIAQSRPPPHIGCPVPGCEKRLRNRTGYHKHLRTRHPEWRANPHPVGDQPVREDTLNADQDESDTTSGLSCTPDKPRTPPC